MRDLGMIRSASPSSPDRGLRLIEGVMIATGVSIFLWSVLWAGLTALV